MKFYMCGMSMCSYAEQSSILRSVSVETETKSFEIYELYARGCNSSLKRYVNSNRELSVPPN